MREMKYKHSPFVNNPNSTKNGLRMILLLLNELKKIHSINVIHRDIKPGKKKIKKTKNKK